jgi:ABC-2 type transport system ATP-binding protein
MVHAVEAQAVTRVFDSKAKNKITALDGVDLEVKEGELFGLLGPNGAGKTTFIKIMCTLLLPTSGTVKVLGHDVVDDFQAIRPRINMVSGGETSGYGLLTVRENLWMFSQFYGIPGKEAHKRIDETLAQFDLLDKADSKVRAISTGQRQKMNVARGFITDPDLLFLDEPTLGLDVSASFVVREYIRKWLHEKKGRTILLTTHYMAEAEDMCERVAIIDKGRILACDTPANLKRSVRESARFSLEVEGDAAPWQPQVAGLISATWSRTEGRRLLTVSLEKEDALTDVLLQLRDRKEVVLGINKEEPTLEEAFVSIVSGGQP